MQRWTIERPDRLTFGPVTELTVRIVAGRLAVLASDGPPMLEVSEIGPAPLTVTHDDGRLSVGHGDPTLKGVLGWLRPDRRSATLTLTAPRDCPVQVGVVSASAVLAGFENRTSVRSVSGDIVLDGVSGEISTETVSGTVESRALAGDLSFTSVAGELTVADGTPRRLRADTVAARITADLVLTPTGHVTVTSISGPVVVRLPADVDTDVVLRSSIGSITTGFGNLRCDGHPGARSVSGRLGGGMASVEVTTVSGDVTLLRGEPRPGGEES